MTRRIAVVVAAAVAAWVAGCLAAVAATIEPCDCGDDE